MKISLDWLNDYVNLEGLTTQEISHALTMVGFEVEGIESSGLVTLENVVVGKIDSFEKHPNADRLSVCQIDVGTGDLRNIVCGAKNFKQGDKVLAALPGAVLPGDFKIKKSKLRGVPSEGMLCSERELGIGEDHAGIAILSGDPELGTPVNDLYPEPDIIFDVEITPNRPDALSHIGIAREMAAWFKRDLQYPDLGVNTQEHESGHLVTAVNCHDEVACPHYLGYSVKDVQVAASPDWLKRRLAAVGLRPINNVVDITNYVLLETGQPLHAFDFAKIKGGEIHIRSAKKGEKITTLDDKERQLQETDLVIADADRALVIAGVMGSVDAEVDLSTNDIFLESAYFNPVRIRKTSKRLGLSTDSSYRFERGIDPKGGEFAALRCLSLILQVAGGKLVGKPLESGESPMTEKEIEVSPLWICERMGFDIPHSEISSALDRLELAVAETETDTGEPIFRVSVPSFRLDLYRPVDLVEEVVRMHGSDKIPEGPVRATVTLREDAPVPVFLRNCSAVLKGQGFEETVHYTLRKESEVVAWYGNELGERLRIANPLSSDASHLRPSLVPGLLDCLKLNHSHHNAVSRLFETGRVFRSIDGQVIETVSIGFVIEVTEGRDWDIDRGGNYYDCQALVLESLGKLGITAAPEDIESLHDDNPWQDGHAGYIVLENGKIEAKFGLLSFEMTREWDLENPIYAGTLYVVPELLNRVSPRPEFQTMSSYPPSIRDISLMVSKETPAGRLIRQIHEIADPVVSEALQIESIRPFDVYDGAGIPDGMKSITVQLVFRSLERTLKDKEVNAVFDSIIKGIGDHPEMEVRH